MAVIVPNLAGIIRRPDGRSLAVLGCSEIDGRTMLHIQGTIDFWATPRELHRKGYQLMAAKPGIWFAWDCGVLGFRQCPAAEVHAGL